MSQLQVRRACELGKPSKEQAWLLEDLWLDNGVGLIGGEPKSYKTFAALSLALATASGQSCFGNYPVKRQGRVLLYAAEDSIAMVRERIAGIAAGMNINVADLDLYVIDEPKLGIDVEIDRIRLEATIVDLKPVLLVLDPFVRLHSIDENSSNEVAKVLSWLRQLQRQYAMNVIMVHHARKRAGRERPGQSLRGSSELHAWGDSNLYLRRIADDENGVELVIEHRAAPSQGNIRLTLKPTDHGPFLQYDGGGTIKAKPKTLEERILEALTLSASPLNGEQIREACGAKTATVWKSLREMIESGVIKKSDDGYHLGGR